MGFAGGPVRSGSGSRGPGGSRGDLGPWGPGGGGSVLSNSRRCFWGEFEGGEPCWVMGRWEVGRCLWGSGGLLDGDRWWLMGCWWRTLEKMTTRAGTRVGDDDGVFRIEFCTFLGGKMRGDGR